MNLFNQRLLGFSWLCLITFLLTNVPSRPCIASVTEPPKPNIVIFFIDDLGYTDIGAYRELLRKDKPFYETPSIDQLANQGVMFTSFYSGHPVCSPTRAALMTGKTPGRLGITDWIRQPSEVHLPLNELTLSEAFRSKGYKTGYIGKWHLGHEDRWQPIAHGFDWQRAVNRAGQPGSYFHPFQRKKRNAVNYWDVPDLDHANPGDYLTDQLSNQAIEYIEANSDHPFLLCLSHYAVHTPIQSPTTLIEKYRAKKKNRFSQSMESIPHTNNSLVRPRQDDPSYAAMIENLDQNVGRVLDCLASQGIKKNTIVVFTSDNGGLSTFAGARRVGPTSVSPLRAGKGWCYEGGIRVPTMIVWPGKLSPQTIDAPAITMDLYPTLLDLTGLKQKPEQHLDGMSLVSEMTNTRDPDLRDRKIGWHYPHSHGSGHTPSSAIRHRNWKLIHRSKPVNEFELFDLSTDVGESKNLAESQPEKLEEMKILLNRWLKKTTTPSIKKRND